MPLAPFRTLFNYIPLVSAACLTSFFMPLPLASTTFYHCLCLVCSADYYFFSYSYHMSQLPWLSLWYYHLNRFRVTFLPESLFPKKIGSCVLLFSRILNLASNIAANSVVVLFCPIPALLFQCSTISSLYVAALLCIFILTSQHNTMTNFPRCFSYSVHSLLRSLSLTEFIPTLSQQFNNCCIIS